MSTNPDVINTTTPTNVPTAATVASPEFHSVVRVKTQLKRDRDLYIYGSEKKRIETLQQVVQALAHKITPESSAQESLEWQYAFRRFCLLTGVAETLSFSATVCYDSELLNSSLAEGRWNVQVDQFARTMEVSTESFR